MRPVQTLSTKDVKAPKPPATAEKPPDARILSHRGYALRKDWLTPEQVRALRSELTVKPNIPDEFAKGIDPFPIYNESSTRYYVPRFWGLKNYGKPDMDVRDPGKPLRPELKCTITLRPKQVPMVDAFKAGDCNGFLCVPCGEGKTVMAIYTMVEIVKRRTLIFVHQEFLADQWEDALKTMVPGIRIGRVQGSKVQLGAVEHKEPSVAELKTLLKERGLKVAGKRADLVARLHEAGVDLSGDPTEEYDVTICMIQTIVSRDWSEDAFDGFGFSIWDEGHHLGAQQFSRAMINVQTMHSMGLSATPERIDGLDRVFLWNIGPIRFQIKVREADTTVEVRVLQYTHDDDAYSVAPLDARGEVSRPRLCTQLAMFAPRTFDICNELEPCLREGRQLLILSDRREHLAAFEAEFARRGFTSCGYYVGGMKTADRELSATKQIVLGTFTLASEGMNIRSLNAVALVTPKSRIEQAVGRIFRLKKEERKFAPIIYDIIDMAHGVCVRQFRKRQKFYNQCQYNVQMIRGSDVEDGSVDDSEDDDDQEEKETQTQKQTQKQTLKETNKETVTNPKPARPMFRS